jgi:antitoxin ParD1/3/4
MDALNVSLPKAMKEYVQERVKTGGYGNTSEYVRDLIRAEQKQRAKEELEALILEGINSGPATPMTKADWDQLRDGLKQRAKERKSK